MCSKNISKTSTLNMRKALPGLTSRNTRSFCGPFLTPPAPGGIIRSWFMTSKLPSKLTTGQSSTWKSITWDKWDTRTGTEGATRELCTDYLGDTFRLFSYETDDGAAYDREFV